MPDSLTHHLLAATIPRMKKGISLFAVLTVVLYANHVVVDHALIDHCHMMSDHRAIHSHADSNHSSCQGHGVEHSSHPHDHHSDEHEGHCHLDHTLVARTGGGPGICSLLPVVVLQKDLDVPQCAVTLVSHVLRGEESSPPGKLSPLVYRSLLL